MRRVARAVCGLWWPVLLLVGLPLGLLRLNRPLVPAHPPTGTQVIEWVLNPMVPGTAIWATLAACWVGWLVLVYAALLEVYRRAARLRRRLPRLYLPGPLQSLSAAVLGAVAVSSAGTSVAQAATHTALIHTTTDHHMPPTRRAPARPTAAAPVARPPTAAAGRGDTAHAVNVVVQVGDEHHTHTVERGDTLWHIAAQWLGNPLRWPEIYHLNAGRYDQHGRMRGGRHIEPGWVLRLPEGALPPPSARPANPPGPSAPAAPGAPTHPAPATPPAPQTSPTPSTPASPTPTPSATSTSTPTGTARPPAGPDPSRTHPGVPRGVSLPGGSWVDLGLAIAISAAAALVWIQRRRRYTPRPPSPTLRLEDPDLAPMPQVVTQVRRGLRHVTPQTSPAVDIDAPPDDEQQPASPVSPPILVSEPDPQPPPLAPALDHPLAQVWPPAGLGLAGPGGQAAARGFLVAALTGPGGLDEPQARGRVVIPAATLATLLGTQALTVPDTPRLSVTTGLPEALEVLESATLHRTRLVYEHEVDTVTALRETDPLEEPLPPLLLIADATGPHERARIAALLTQGQRLDIHGVLLGRWDDGNTVHVAADGSTIPADDTVSRHGAHPADVGRLTVLNPTETADLLRTLAEAHTGAAQPAPPIERTVPAADRPDDAEHDACATPDEKKADHAWPAPANDPPAPDTGAMQRPREESASSTSQASTGAALAQDPGTAATPGPAQETGSVARPAAATRQTGGEPDDEGTGGDEAEGIDDRAVAPPAAEPGHARVCVLGPPHIAELPAPQQPKDQPLRSKALEVLVYLVANGGQAPQHRVIADVLPNELHSRAHHRLNTFVSNLRVNLNRAGGKARYVAPPTEQYALSRDALAVDLWRMHSAIATAHTATDPAARIAALREAVACYTGPLAEGHDYEWVEPYREAVRQQAIDAHLGLVAAISHDDPAEALTVLHAAISHDPYNETLYQQAMHLAARLGDIQAIRDLRRTVTRRMGEIDTDPNDDTTALANQLVTDLQRHPHRPNPVRGDAPSHTATQHTGHTPGHRPRTANQTRAQTQGGPA